MRTQNMLSNQICRYNEEKKYTPRQTDFILALCQQQIDFSKSRIFRMDSYDDYSYLYLKALCEVVDMSGTLEDFLDTWKKILDKPIIDFRVVFDMQDDFDYIKFISLYPNLKDKKLRDIPFQNTDWANMAKVALKHTKVFNLYDVRELQIYNQLIADLSQIRDIQFEAYANTWKNQSASQRDQMNQSNQEKQFRAVLGQQSEDTQLKTVHSLLSAYSALSDIGKPEVGSMIKRYISMANKARITCPDVTADEPWDLVKVLAQTISLAFGLSGRFFDTSDSPTNNLRTRHTVAESVFIISILQTWIQFDMFTNPEHTHGTSKLPPSKRMIANDNVMGSLAKLTGPPKPKVISPEYVLKPQKKTSKKLRPTSQALTAESLADHFRHLEVEPAKPGVSRSTKRIQLLDKEVPPILLSQTRQESESTKPSKTRRYSDSELESPQVRRKTKTKSNKSDDKTEPQRFETKVLTRKSHKKSKSKKT